MVLLSCHYGGVYTIEVCCERTHIPRLTFSPKDPIAIRLNMVVSVTVDFRPSSGRTCRKSAETIDNQLQRMTLDIWRSDP